jgi:DNA processing protein
MALGIDATAHQGALDRGGGTVAVLAGGADVPYPASRRPLYRRIVGTGCVVSELPPGFRAHKWCFPARNRIIAGLAQLTIVVEAASRSGSLITAGIARDLGREVGAVPGRVTSPVAAGTNELLADGARLIRDAGDVLDALYGVGARPTRSAAPDPGAGLPPALRSLLAAVGDGCDTLGALVARGLDLEAALSGLAELEVQGRLRRGLGGRYVVAS